MATKKSNPPNPEPGGRPLDTADSLRPSSLPPQLAGIDMSWDDEPGSLSALDRFGDPTLDLDLDAGERTTAIPDIPMSELVKASMAEAETRERAQSSAFDERPPTRQRDPHPLRGMPAVADAHTPTPSSQPPATVSSAHSDAEGPTTPFRPSPQVAGNTAFRTQPAPARTAAEFAPVDGNRAEPASEASTSSRAGRGGGPPMSVTAYGSLGREPASSGKHAVPTSPPLTSRSMAGPVGPPSSRPPSRRGIAFSEAPPTARGELDTLRQAMKDRYATGDFSGALDVAEAILSGDSGDLEAQRFSTSCRDVLTQMYLGRIGSVEQLVQLVRSPEEQRWLTLDHRAGFLLSLVDGNLTVEELLDISGMQKLESLRILVNLLEQRVVRLVPP